MLVGREALVADLRAWLGAAAAKGVALRVIPAPDTELFSTSDLETFLSATYEIRPDSNRIGLRLSGPVLRPPEHQGQTALVERRPSAGSRP